MRSMVEGGPPLLTLSIRRFRMPSDEAVAAPLHRLRRSPSPALRAGEDAPRRFYRSGIRFGRASHPAAARSRGGQTPAGLIKRQGVGEHEGR